MYLCIFCALTFKTLIGLKALHQIQDQQLCAFVRSYNTAIVFAGAIVAKGFAGAIVAKGFAGAIVAIVMLQQQ